MSWEERVGLTIWFWLENATTDDCFDEETEGRNSDEFQIAKGRRGLNVRLLPFAPSNCSRCCVFLRVIISIMRIVVIRFVTAVVMIMVGAVIVHWWFLSPLLLAATSRVRPCSLPHHSLQGHGHGRRNGAKLGLRGGAAAARHVTAVRCGDLCKHV